MGETEQDEGAEERGQAQNRQARRIAAVRPLRPPSAYELPLVVREKARVRMVLADALQMVVEDEMQRAHGASTEDASAP